MRQWRNQSLILLSRHHLALICLTTRVRKIAKTWCRWKKMTDAGSLQIHQRKNVVTGWISKQNLAFIRRVKKNPARASRAPDLNNVHTTDSHFRSVLNYRTYRLINKLQACNCEITVRFKTYCKRMEILIKAYIFYDNDSITVLHFSAQLRNTYVWYEVSKVMARPFMQTFMRDEPSSSVTVWKTLYKDDDTTQRRLEIDDK